MTISSHAVALVLDPEFGEALIPIAKRIHTWIVDSPTNRQAAESLWNNQITSVQSKDSGVTLFKVDPSSTATEWCIGILDTIDLHHGEYSHEPALSGIEVYGLPFNESIRDPFAEFGFTSISQSGDGFIASAPQA